MLFRKSSCIDDRRNTNCVDQEQNFVKWVDSCEIEVAWINEASRGVCEVWRGEEENRKKKTGN